MMDRAADVPIDSHVGVGGCCLGVFHRRRRLFAVAVTVDTRESRVRHARSSVSVTCRYERT